MYLFGMNSWCAVEFVQSEAKTLYGQPACAYSLCQDKFVVNSKLNSGTKVPFRH